jgi:hypothetical protein
MEVTTTRTSTALTTDSSISRAPAAFLAWNATIAVAKVAATKGQQAEGQGPPSCAPELGEVDLQPGKKHQQQLADLRKKIGDGVCPGEYTKAAGA